MTNSRTEHVYCLFIDYLVFESMDVEDCISIMQGFELSLDYEGSQGVYDALVDYVCMFPLSDLL